MKKLITTALTAAFTLTLGLTAFAADCSANWYLDSAGWHIKDENSTMLKNTWLCDDVQDPTKSTWYLIDSSGTMVISPLVQDGTGNLYSLETEHTGYYGSLRHTDGTYDGIALTFEQDHNGSFGAIRSGADALKAKYSIADISSINNLNTVYTSSFTSENAASEGVAAGSSSPASGTGTGADMALMKSKWSDELSRGQFVVDSSKPEWQDGKTNIRYFSRFGDYFGSDTCLGGGYVYIEQAGCEAATAWSEDGYMLADCYTPDGYYVNTYGVVEIDGITVEHKGGLSCMYAVCYADGTSVDPNNCDYSRVPSRCTHSFPANELLKWGRLIYKCTNNTWHDPYNEL